MRWYCSRRRGIRRDVQDWNETKDLPDIPALPRSTRTARRWQQHRREYGTSRGLLGVGCSRAEGVGTELARPSDDDATHGVTQSPCLTRLVFAPDVDQRAGDLTDGRT